MKKIWKNLCACSLALACSAGLTACGDGDVPVSVDLDGDGVVSSWETLFDNESHKISSSVVGEVVYIKTADQLLDINNNVDKRCVYVLASNIDLQGKEVSINLGKSEFYGFNYVISNFKLGLADPGVILGGYNETSVRCLFYNGAGVFSTKIFMGVQDVNIDSTANESYYGVSALFNVPAITDVQVKGKLNINVSTADGRSLAKVDASLLYSGCTVESTDTNDVTSEKENVVAIEKVSVDGVINLNEAKRSFVCADIGGVASGITKDSSLYDAYAQVYINAGVSMETSNIGGVIGYNRGFVSTCIHTGNITINNENQLSAENQCVGGVVGTNYALAEIKNSSSNANITFINSTQEEVVVYSNYYFGGIAGKNNGGVLELCMSDAIMKFGNLSNITVGGLCGFNNNGILSYNICRGSIEVNSVEKVDVAQVVGLSNFGMFEKIVTTTGITVNNTNLASKVRLGMVTIFEDHESSPYFRKILVDGNSIVYTREQDNSNFDYNLGLRYPYKQLVGQDQEGNDEYEVILPSIFDDLYVTDTCKVFKFSQLGEVQAEDTISIIYPNNKVSLGTKTSRWMIDYMDFKNYLNHNEVNLGSTLVLGDLCFTLDDENDRLTSYFGSAMYNGELAYFDREFTQSYEHSESSLGSCENDNVDEMLSFVYYMINSNNGKAKETYAIKITDSYLNKAPDANEVEEGLKQNSYLLMNKIKSVFNCLNTNVKVTKLDANLVDVETDDSGNLDVKYLQFTFSDSGTNYTMKVDISNLENTEDSVYEGEYVLYVTFSL